MIELAQGIEGLERVLEDRLHGAHEQLAATRATDVREVLAEETYGAARRRFHAEDHARQRGLAAPRLTDDGEYLGRVGLESKAHIVHRGNAPAREQAAEAERLGDMRELEQRGHAVPPPPDTAKQATR